VDQARISWAVAEMLCQSGNPNLEALGRRARQSPEGPAARHLPRGWSADRLAAREDIGSLNCDYGAVPGPVLLPGLFFATHQAAGEPPPAAVEGGSS
jgi:hypothetical protein